MLEQLLSLNDSDQFHEHLYPAILLTAGHTLTGYAFAGDVVKAMNDYRQAQGDLGQPNAKLFVQAVVTAFLDGETLDDALRFIEESFPTETE
jgi:hypothetical protein